MGRTFQVSRTFQSPQQCHSGGLYPITAPSWHGTRLTKNLSRASLWLPCTPVRKMLCLRHHMNFQRTKLQVWQLQEQQPMGRKQVSQRGANRPEDTNSLCGQFSTKRRVETGDRHEQGKEGKVGKKTGDGKGGACSKWKPRWVAWLCALQVSLHSF